VKVPTLAADGEVEAAVRSPALDHEPLCDRSAQGAAEISRAQPREALRQLTATAETVVGKLDDRRHDRFWGR
jgi:hypothetical protein